MELQACKREGCTERFKPKPRQLFCKTAACRRARRLDWDTKHPEKVKAHWDRGNRRTRAQRLDAWLKRIESEGLATVRREGGALLQACKREGCTEEFEPKPGKLYCNTVRCRRALAASRGKARYAGNKKARLEYAKAHRDRDNATRRARYRRDPEKVLRKNRERRRRNLPKIQEAARGRYAALREMRAKAKRMLANLERKEGKKTSQEIGQSVQQRLPRAEALLKVTRRLTREARRDFEQLLSALSNEGFSEAEISAYSGTPWDEGPAQKAQSLAIRFVAFSRNENLELVSRHLKIYRKDARVG